MMNDKNNFNNKNTHNIKNQSKTGRLAFKKVYQNKIAPLLKKYEKERITILRTLIISICFFLILYPILIIRLLISTNDCFWALILLFLTILYISSCVEGKKFFENKIKKRIMPEVCNCIGNINWYNHYIGGQSIQNSGVIDYFTDVFSDDYFYGSYKNVGIEVIESESIYISNKTKYNKAKNDHSINVKKFKGAIIVLDLNKKFKGHTVIAEKGKQSYKAQRLKETSLEDIEFNKQYTVFTNDEVEARYLLTPSFMERLKNIKNVFQAKYVSCSFYQGKLYIALHTGKDLFALGSLIKSVNDPEPYYQMFDEIYSIMKLVKHFKLNEKTGL